MRKNLTGNLYGGPWVEAIPHSYGSSLEAVGRRGAKSFEAIRLIPAKRTARMNIARIGKYWANNVPSYARPMWPMIHPILPSDGLIPYLSNAACSTIL